MRGYALDALERQAEPEKAPKIYRPDDTKEFFDLAQKASEEIYDSVGLGQDVRLSSDSVTGSSLVWDEQVVHASLFTAMA